MRLEGRCEETQNDHYGVWDTNKHSRRIACPMATETQNMSLHRKFEGNKLRGDIGTIMEKSGHCWRLWCWNNFCMKLYHSQCCKPQCLKQKKIEKQQQKDKKFSSKRKMTGSVSTEWPSD